MAHHKFGHHLARDDDRATMGVWKWKHAIRQASERQTRQAGRHTVMVGCMAASRPEKRPLQGKGDLRETQTPCRHRPESTTAARWFDAMHAHARSIRPRWPAARVVCVVPVPLALAGGSWCATCLLPLCQSSHSQAQKSLSLTQGGMRNHTHAPFFGPAQINRRRHLRLVHPHLVN
jgi:hypothetical protein